jgi:hypothetical protein
MFFGGAGEGADAYLTEPDVEEKDIVDINVVI